MADAEQTQFEGLRLVDSSSPSDVKKIGKTVLDQNALSFLDKTYEDTRKLETGHEQPDTTGALVSDIGDGEEADAFASGEDNDSLRDSESDELAAFGRRGPSRPLIRETKPEADKSRSRKQRDVYFQSATSKTFSQRVSDYNRRERSLAQYGEGRQLLAKDDGRSSVAAAAMYAGRVRGLEKENEERRARGEEVKDFGRTVTEVDATTGLRTRGFLDTLKQDHPEVYGHPEFKATVMSQNAAAIRESGIFSGHDDKVEVRESSLDQAPELPEKTLFTMFTGTEHAPVYRLSKPADGGGRVIEALARTRLESDAPVVTVERTKEGRDRLTRTPATAFFSYKTAEDTEASARFAPKISTKVYQELRDPRSKKNPDAPNSKWLDSLDRHDDDVDRTMRDWPQVDAHIKHYSPELEERTAAIARTMDPNGLIMVDAPIRNGQQPMKWGDLSSQKGGLVSNVVEGDTLVDGAAVAGKKATFYTPERAPQDEGKYTVGLLDLTGEKALADSSAADLKRIITAPGIYSKTLLERAQTELEAAERSGVENGADRDAAVKAIISQYDAYVDSRGLTIDPDTAKQLTALSSETGKEVQGPALPKLDGDLARGLAHTFREHGHYDEAVSFAKKAIDIAPHADSSARVEMAKALTASGSLAETDELRQHAFDEAWQQLDAAGEISPRSVDVHVARADLALRQERWSEFSDALVAIQRDAPAISELGRDTSLHPNLRSIFGYRDAEQADTSAGNTHEAEPVAEVEAIAKLWHAKLWADEETIEQSARAGKTILVRAEQPQLDSDGSWVIKPKYKELKADWWERSQLAEDAQETASTLYRILSDTAPGRRQWQDRLVAPILEIVDRNKPHIQSGLILTGEDLLAARQFDMDHEAVAESTELVPLQEGQGTEKIKKAEGLSFPYAVKNWKTDRPETDLNIYYTDTPDHDQDYGPPGIIQGESGSGKTTLAQTLMKQNVEDGYSVWVWDIGERAQHRNLGEAMGDTAAVTDVRFGNKDFPLASLALMEPEPGFDMQRHIGLVRMALLFATSAEEPFPQITGSSLQNLMASTGQVRRSTGKWDTTTTPEGEESAMDFREFVEEVIGYTDIYEGGDVQGNVKGFLRARLEELMSGDVGQHIESQHALNVRDLMHSHQVVHPDFSDITNPKDRKFLMALLYVKRMEVSLMDREANGDRDLSLQGIDYFEEAQSVFGSKRGPESPESQMAEYFGNVVRQNRGNGWSTMALVQESDEIKVALPSLINNAALRIVLRTQNPDARNAILAGTGADKESDPDKYDRVASFERGEFLVSRGTTSKPLLASIPAPERHVPLPPRQFRVRNGYRTQDGMPPTPQEINDIERRLGRPEYASWGVFATADALARMTANPLPQIPGEMQRQYEDMTPRQRELMLQVAAAQAVERRTRVIRRHYNPAKLRAAVTADGARMLDGVPLAGHNPGAGFSVPELNSALLKLRLEDPYVDTAPDPRTPVYVPAHNLPGLDRALQLERDDTSNLPLAMQVRQSIGRVATTVSSHADQEARNQEIALKQLNGTDMDTERQLFQHMTAHEPDMAKLWQKVSEDLGLRRKGDPRPSWLEELMAMPERTLWSAKADVNNAQRATAGQATGEQLSRPLPAASAARREVAAPARPAEVVPQVPVRVETVAGAGSESAEQFKKLWDGDLPGAFFTAVQLYLAHSKKELGQEAFDKAVEGNSRQYAQGLYDKLKMIYELGGAEAVVSTLKNMKMQ